MKIARMAAVVLSSVFVCFASPSSVYAQRGGGMRGMMGPNRVQLCTLKEVQSELKLSDDQKKVLAEINEKYSSDLQELRQNAGGDFAGMMEKSTKLANDAASKVNDKLDETQKSRLTQIFVQASGSNALLDAAVQKELKITEDQAKKLTEARAANRESMMGAFGSLQNASQDERQSKMAELQKSSNERLLGCLSDDQKSAFEKLGGAKIELDLSSLAPRRPNN